MPDLRNVLNIKEFSEKMRSKKSEKVFFKSPLSETSVWKIFWDVLFSEKKRRPRQHFPDKFSLSEKLFLSGTPERKLGRTNF